MTKKKQALWSIIGAVVILGSVGGVIYRVNDRSTVKIQERVEALCEVEQITRIVWQGEDGTELILQDDMWHNKQLNHLEYNQAELTEWVKALEAVTSQKIIKNVEDITSFGFTTEAPVITITDQDQISETFYLGGSNHDEQLSYIMKAEDPIIYMIDHQVAQQLFRLPNTFVEVAQIKLPTVTKNLTVVSSDETRLNFGLGQEDYLTDEVGGVYYLQSGQGETLANLVNTLEVMEYVGTYEMLASNEAPSAQLQVTLDEINEIHIWDTQDAYSYLSVNEALDVYKVDRIVYDTLNAIKTVDVIQKEFIQVDRSAVSQIVLTNPQGTYTLMLDESQVALMEQEGFNVALGEENVEATDQIEEQVSLEDELAVDKESAPIKGFLNAMPLNEEEASLWVEKINKSLLIEAPLQNPKIEQKNERKAEATIIYTLADGSEWNLEMIPYDINYYILRYNGKVQFAMNKDKIVKLFLELSHLE